MIKIEYRILQLVTQFQKQVGIIKIFYTDSF